VCDDAGRVSPAASGLTAPDRILAFLVGSQLSARSDQLLFVEDADNVPNFSGGPALRPAPDSILTTPWRQWPLRRPTRPSRRSFRQKEPRGRPPRTIAALTVLRDQAIAPILAGVRTHREDQTPATWDRNDQDYETPCSLRFTSPRLRYSYDRSSLPRGGPRTQGPFSWTWRPRRRSRPPMG
jgi:hypothetical protein